MHGRRWASTPTLQSCGSRRRDLSRRGNPFGGINPALHFNWDGRYDERMKITLIALFLIVCSVVRLNVIAADAPKEAELPLIASPTFDAPLDSSFSVAKGTWTPAMGVLTAVEVPEDKHVAVLHHNVGLSAAVIDCEFKLDGSPAFLVGCDGKAHHVGRVVVKGGSVEIAEDSAKTSHVIASLKMPVAQGQWHHLRVEWKGDEMIATLDGQSVRAKHEYFATPKTRSWLAVPKSKTEIRKLTIRGEKTEAK